MFDVWGKGMYPWRIQVFPEGGANSQSGRANQFFAENWMKMKTFGTGGRFWRPPLCKVIRVSTHTTYNA